MKRAIFQAARFLIFAIMMVSCGKKIIPPSPPPEPETVIVIEEAEPVDMEVADEEIIEEEIIEEEIKRRIIVPYTKEYLSPGQETKITVRLEDGDYGDEMDFSFMKEPGKNSIEVEGIYNVAVIKAIGEGEQYIRISHPKAQKSRFIVYDVLPLSPAPPPEIDVSESPMIIGKGETKPLRMILLNGNTADRGKFQFQVVENAYTIEVSQDSDILHVTGIAPGAGKIRIHNPAALRDYDVMVIVD